jgi:polar amino acid transport system permease protein
MGQRLISEIPAFFGYYNLLFLMKAALATITLSAIGALTGIIAGLGLALLRLTLSPWLAPARWIAIILTEFFRRVPFLVTLMLVFFASQLSGLDLPLFAVALIAVFFIAAAYLAEIIRAGFESVHRNQWDAAVAMNFTMLETVRHVILPQAWRVILPPAFAFFVLFIKDTALASQIGVLELTYAGKVLNNKGFSAALVFGTLLLLYFCISYPLTRLGAHLEARLAPTRHR